MQRPNCLQHRKRQKLNKISSDCTNLSSPLWSQSVKKYKMPARLKHIELAIMFLIRSLSMCISKGHFLRAKSKILNDYWKVSILKIQRIPKRRKTWRRPRRMKMMIKIKKGNLVLRRLHKVSHESQNIPSQEQRLL